MASNYFSVLQCQVQFPPSHLWKRDAAAGITPEEFAFPSTGLSQENQLSYGDPDVNTAL